MLHKDIPEPADIIRRLIKERAEAIKGLNMALEAYDINLAEEAKKISEKLSHKSKK